MKTTYNGIAVKLCNVDGELAWFETETGNFIGKAKDVKVQYDHSEEVGAQGKYSRALFLARMRKGYTMDYVVAITGIGKPSINGYEKGKITPSIENLSRLGLFYGCDFLNIDSTLKMLEASV